MPVRANITTNDQRYPVGSDIQIPCEVMGYPEPQVQWYKDGVAIHPSDRIQISGKFQNIFGYIRNYIEFIF